MTTAQIKRNLKSNALRITFTKKDGTERKMLCTTDWKTIRKYADEFEFEEPKNPGSRPLPKHLIRVWDMEKLDWRIVNLNTVSAACFDGEEEE